jgi:predicted Zn-dependent protease
VVPVLAGCQGQLPKVADAKVEAAKRWNAARARMLYGVALEHFRVGQLDRATHKVLEAIALDGECLEARVLLSKLHIEEGRHARAREELAGVLDKAPQSPEAFYLLGVAQEKGGQLEEALASYRRAHALNEADVAPVVAAAEVLVAIGRIHDAQTYVDSYAPKAGDDAALCELGGRLAMMRRDYPKAAVYYQRAVDLDARNRRYAEALGRAQFLAGKHEQAVETLRRLTASEDCSPWVYVILGDCHTALDDASAARESYAAAAERMESSAGVRAKLAEATLRAGDRRRAIAIAREAVRLDDGSLDAALVLGHALLLDGQAKQAVAELTAASRRHAHSPTLWCLLGRSHAARGEREAAARCYTSALRADPACGLARELLKQMGAKEISRKP